MIDGNLGKELHKKMDSWPGPSCEDLLYVVFPDGLTIFGDRLQMLLLASTEKEAVVYTHEEYGRLFDN